MKRTNPDVTLPASKKKKIAEKEPSSESEDFEQELSDVSEAEQALADGLNETLQEDFLPAFKRHLGSQAAKTLMLKLSSFTDQGPVDEQYAQNLELAETLLKSWETVQLPTYTEDEKLKLRGDAVLTVWDQELNEKEITLKKERFLLGDLPLALSDGEGEESDDEGDNISKADLTLETCRKVPLLFVSSEVDVNLRMINQALEQTAGGLENLDFVSDKIVSFWANCLENANESLDKNEFKEAFITLLAITETMFGLESWVTENKDVKSVSKTMTELAGAWKKCLAKSFDELGVVGERSDLITWLKKGSDEIKELNPAVPPFTWNLH